MPPARIACVPLLSRQPLFIFRSPAIRYAPLRSIRSLRKLARSRASNATSESQSASWSQKDDDKYADSGPKDINFFEVDEETPNKRRRVGIDASEEDDLDVLRSREKELKNAIQGLEEDIDSSERQEEGLRSGEAFQMTEEDQGRMQQALLDSIDEMQSGPGILESELPHRIKPQQKLPKSSMLFLRKLNESLDAASVDVVDAQTRQSLWRYYERSKIYISGILQMLPEEAWQLLWTSQSEETSNDLNRSLHLKTLGQDMAKAGRTLTEEQRFARLEGMFWDGKPDEALEQWETGLSEGDGGKAEYLEMGIRLYAYDRNLDRSEQLLHVLFNLHPTREPRIILQLVTASVGRGKEGDVERAWLLYQRFRQLMSSDVTMEDYDQVCLAFVRAGHKEHALAVFRDMMFAGEVQKTPSGIVAAVTRLGAFVSSSSDKDEVNSLNLNSLAFLPPLYQNKYFYASWMKRLIGMDEMQAAAQVLELMQERGVRPDAKHVNGLIHGWLRGTDKAAHKEAEKIAWSMIQSRLEFVQRRRQLQQPHLEGPSKSILDFDTDQPDAQPQVPVVGRTGPLPPASIETFSILVQWYLRRSVFANIRHLRNLLASCEIPMNSYFMNHLLYAELRNRTHQEVWTRFLVMSRTVTPDVDTFTCLWDCMKNDVGPGKPELRGRQFIRIGFPAPRDLMRRMSEWFAKLQGQQKRDALADMNIDTYNNIIRCFCLSRDPAGSFVAIHCLRKMFDIAPNQDSMRLLVMQIARLNLHGPKNHQEARRITASKKSQENIARTTEVLDLITQYRGQGYEERGVKPENMGREWRSEEQHRVAMQLLYTVVEQVGVQGADDANSTQIIQNAAKEMGVEELDIESSMALIA